MKNYTRVLIGLLAGIFTFSCFYLGGSFANATFNIIEWSDESRRVVGGLGMFASVIMIAIVIGILFERK